MDDIEYLRKTVLCDETVNDYLLENFEGKKIRELVGEILFPFMKYLRIVYDNTTTDIVIDKIY